MLSKEEIQQLKTMHLREFGEEISDEQVIECAQSLLDLLTAIYKPSEKNA
ncbi:MAG: hypothetical protein UR99_C0062G0005 [Candidatus Moranbacteria bacterium GW2011_GWD2_36_12]|nr:MAG: hypothetical protein UR99_C0062G0005 [Candidatus Moranbacteria bacterium GW2011_GWD2_36_12]